MSKLLRITAYILLGLTAAQTLLGAVGSVCISWFPEKYEKLIAVIPYKHIYQVATIFTFIAAFIGIWALIGLIRGKKNAYNAAILALLIGITTALTKMHYSRMLRGSTMPTDIRLYLTIVTLVYLLFLGLPFIRQKVDFSHTNKDTSGATGAGVALILAGIQALTVQYWAGPSHTMNGYNLVLVLQVPLFISGVSLIISGVGILIRLSHLEKRTEKAITRIPLRESR